ncbi:uncharacterized protein A4U43_C09F10650 [Asparagus officinalis]|uniref:RRM domain-containing protein n=1 Tax=Asparagus officinalis TaxID=4686 RepID=A0A5P1E6V5_ASPOF|nr:28 kDa ribonucleoprotein, chloroplastic-like [Asparagus officinalis]ONK58290.1 uncharacterized protein A4U43_C09F10650 [Asparagus officinalis]
MSTSCSTSLLKPLFLPTISSLLPPKTPFLSLPSKPLLHLLPPLSLKKRYTQKLTPFVTQTSDWAQQGDSQLTTDQEAAGWEGEGESDGEGGVVVAEGEDAFVEGEGGDEVGVEEVEGGEEEEESYPEPPEDAKLFVGNLPYDVDSQRLAELFEKAGIVEVAEVIYNRETDQSRGFGFVTMSTVEEAEKAVDMFHRYDVNGRLLTVNKAAPRGARPERPPREFEPSFRVYVGNLPWQVDDGRLEQVFSEHGKVLNARVVYDRETGRSRGFGFVSMATQTELDDAIAALDGQDLDGRALRVNVAEERPRRASF